MSACGPDLDLVCEFGFLALTMFGLASFSYLPQAQVGSRNWCPDSGLALGLWVPTGPVCVVLVYVTLRCFTELLLFLLSIFLRLFTSKLTVSVVLWPSSSKRRTLTQHFWSAISRLPITQHVTEIWLLFVLWSSCLYSHSPVQSPSYSDPCPPPWTTIIDLSLINSLQRRQTAGCCDRRSLGYLKCNTVSEGAAAH